MNYLVAIHELVEAFLCKQNFITPKMVDDFDLAHPELDDPGGDTRAPYHIQHLYATSVEVILAHQVGIDWDKYEDVLSLLWEKRDIADKRMMEVMQNRPHD